MRFVFEFRTKKVGRGLMMGGGKSPGHSPRVGHCGILHPLKKFDIIGLYAVCWSTKCDIIGLYVVC